jgi:asparagine synthetase B (glutamine-hydrolysing)
LQFDHYHYGRCIIVTECAPKLGAYVNSVENRVPFLDNRFIELIFSTNEDQLVHPMFTNVLSSKRISALYEGKYILKQMSCNVYGKEFAFRKKQAVRVPLDMYIKNHRFQNYLNELIIPGMKKRGQVDMKEFERTYADLNQNDNTLMVWKAINMEAWMQLFYDGRRVVDF